MEASPAKRSFCVFNRTRESFLSLCVLPAETLGARLAGLLGRIKLAPEDGIWLVPLLGVHTIGMLFPIDLIYLDRSHRVLHLVEHLDPFRISPVHGRCASLLELRSRTIYFSRTQVGDQLLICSPEEVQSYWQHRRAPAGFDEKGGMAC